MNKIDRLLVLADLIEDSPTSPSATAFPYAGKVMIRSVTHYYVGEVIDVRDGFVILGNAAWVADTGRFSTFLASGSVNEVEPYPNEVAVSLGAIIDASPWSHDLFRSAI